MNEIKTIYENKDLLVVNKPSGMRVYSPRNENTLMGKLIKKYPRLKEAGKPNRYGLVHRLDQPTSGLLLVAKNNEALSFLQRQFKERKVEKKYWALVSGSVEPQHQEIKTLIGPTAGNPGQRKVYLPHSPQAHKGKKAITEIHVEKKFSKYTLLKVDLKTGRTHQIRVHLSWLHHPVVGDKKYQFKDSPVPEDLDRLFLHAFYLKIKLPSGEEKEFTSPLPQELKQIISCLY